MRRQIFLLLMAIGLLSCNKSESPNEIKYYSKLTGIISPFLEYKPRGQLSLQELNDKTYYKVTYDSANRISEIEYYKGTNADNQSYYYTHSVKYQYKPDQLIRTYFDDQGNRMAMWRHYYQGDAIHKEVFQLNEQGKRVSLQLFDTLGNRVSNGLNIYEYQVNHLNDHQFIQQQFDSLGNPLTLTGYFPFEKALISTDQY
ncbi:MAG: hypothetical protein RLO81_11185, partial [Fulvivirga sp.]|uniref:hypothetical protein n=1 Tax=Fulvivirga sp. TaxID=1931237 RepID=UPI0032EC2DDA